MSTCIHGDHVTENGHNLHRCNEENCPVCRGGLSDLALCTVCGGAEASMPTDCPGFRMPASVEELVLKGQMDYIDGKWVEKVPKSVEKR
jgi:hypothetical protein